MKMTAEEFDQSITMVDRYEISRDKTPKEIEEIKSLRFALGVIIGGDFQGGSTQRVGYRSCITCGSQWSIGLRVYLTLLRHCVEGELSKVLSDVTLTSLL